MAQTELLTPEAIAAIEGLELRARTIVDSVLTGRHRSVRRGFSIEFAEHREYAPGDDVRYVDWKIFGKRDRLYVKQFEDETRLRAWCAVDVTRSMRYRSAGAAMSKLNYAATMAAALSWLVLRQRDEAGLALFEEQDVQVVPARTQADQLTPLCRALTDVIGDETLVTQPVEHADAEEETSWEGLARLADRLPQRGMVFILTDGFGDPDRLTAAIHGLHLCQHDVRLVQIVDPAEEDFPFEEAALFQGMETGEEQFVTPKSLADAYRSEFRSFVELLSRGCQQMHCRYHLVRTDERCDTALLRMIGEPGR